MLHNTSVRQDLGYCTLFAPSQHQWWNVAKVWRDLFRIVSNFQYSVGNKNSMQPVDACSCDMNDDVAAPVTTVSKVLTWSAFHVSVSFLTPIPKDISRCFTQSSTGSTTKISHAALHNPVQDQQHRYLTLLYTIQYRINNKDISRCFTQCSTGSTTKISHAAVHNPVQDQQQRGQY